MRRFAMRRYLAVPVIITAFGLTSCATVNVDTRDAPEIRKSSTVTTPAVQNSTPASNATSTATVGDTPLIQSSDFSSRRSVPSNWKDKGSLKVSEHMVVNGKYGYPGDISILGDNISLTPPSEDTPGQPVIIGPDGDVVYQYTPIEMDAATVETGIVKTPETDYLIIVQTQGVEQESTGPSALLTVVNETGTETISRDINSNQGIEWGKNVLVITDYTTGTPQMVNLETGELSDLPAMPGHRWEGRFNGVDVFALLNVAEDQGVITNGEWTVETDTYTPKFSTSYHTSGVEQVGNYLQVTTGQTDDNGNLLCILVDPTTGNESLASDLLEGNCVQAQEISPDGNIAVVEPVEDDDRATGFNGIIDFSADSVIALNKDEKFKVRSITNEGEIYGYLEGKAALIHTRESKNPVRIKDADLVPNLVTGGETAVFFTAEDTHLVFG